MLMGLFYLFFFCVHVMIDIFACHHRIVMYYVTSKTSSYDLVEWNETQTHVLCQYVLGEGLASFSGPHPPFHCLHYGKARGPNIFSHMST